MTFSRLLTALFFSLPLSLLADSRLQNIATRGLVGNGDQVLIGGFVIAGENPKTVIIRAMGPSLADQGVDGVLSNPQLNLYSGSNVVARNNDWLDHENAEMVPVSLQPQDSREAVIVMTLEPGAYTAIVSGVDNEEGIGLLEIFEFEKTGDSRLINLATRGYVRNEDEVLIAGFVIAGDSDKRILIRGRGPSLDIADVQVSVEIPQVSLYSGSVLIEYGNFFDTYDVPRGLKLINRNEKAIYRYLAPGPYTAILSGALPNREGLGIIEVFDMPEAPEYQPHAFRPLNDTGLIFGSDYPEGGNNALCNGVSIHEQDCANGRDANDGDDIDGHAGFSFTKLDIEGNALNSSALNWSCVQDNVTRLIWEVKTTDSSIHDREKTFRWGGKGADQFGFDFFNDWDELVDGSNEEKFCGFSDWRVPSIQELETLVNFNRFDPAIDTAYFPNTEHPNIRSPYWSSSANANGDERPWLIHFSDGLTKGFDTGLSGRVSSAYQLVRLVRGDK